MNSIGSETTEPRENRNTLQRQAAILVTILGLMWSIEVIDWLTFFTDFDRFGIMPRTFIGLRNIFLAPFLHVGFRHIFANSVPFALLGWFVMLRSIQDFWLVTFLAILMGGMTVWLLAATNTVHLGASSLVFGYLGYLLMRGLFERSLQASSLALLVLFLYGSMIWGVLPLQPGVSWLGHLGGFLGGGLAGYLRAER